METRKISGEFIPSSQRRALCEQTPWLQNGTIRDNIIGISSYDEDWYKTVIHACALVDDFAKCPSGDQTRVGSGGFAISGGQKQRIALARALYSRAQLFLLDDIFSGLDTTSEFHILTHVFGQGSIMDRLDATVILVTHSTRWIPRADFIVVMSEGRIVEQYSPKMCEVGRQPLGGKEQAPLIGGGQTMKLTEDGESVARSPESVDDGSSTLTVSDFEVYKTYLISSGRLNMLAFIVVLCVLTAETNFQTVWLNRWASHGQGQVALYISVYCGLVVFGVILFLAFCAILLCIVAPQSSRELHNLQLASVFNAPMSLFTMTDIGSLVNRFTQDMMLIDTSLPFAMLNTFGNAIGSIGSIIIIVVGAPYVGVALPFLLATLWLVQKFYLRTSTQLRTLDLELKAPLFDHILESVSGLATIRAFDWSRAFDKRKSTLLDQSQKPMFLLAAIQIWLGMILDLTVGVLVVVVTTLGVATRTSADAGWIGLSLFQLVSCINLPFAYLQMTKRFRLVLAE
jgi:ATP-binding cassette subfamily C (CFTR/MRP) protein 1